MDGIYGMLPKDKMEKHVLKYRDFLAIKPGASVFQQEFGFYCLEKWQSDEGLSKDADLNKLFGYDEPAVSVIGGLGGCEASFIPEFDVIILEDRGDYELVQDHAGRHVLYFKNRRNGFMPEYVDHPVKDWVTWEEKCKWRMDPYTSERQTRIQQYMPGIVEKAKRGYVIEQYLVGGYMYLRSLIGPEALLYLFYDDPKLIHECMETWFKLADHIIALHQKQVSLDLILLDEDVCYNHGPLISPAMIREFLVPYYQQLLYNVRSRQLDKERQVFYHVGSDGFFDPVIGLYREIGMRYLSPFEVAAGSDVIRTGYQYQDISISGGIDKRILAQGKDAIDKMIDTILPVMKERGGYIPTCDHGVPEEVTLDNYIYYRKRCLEFV